MPVDWRNINVIESSDSVIACEHVANSNQSMQFALELLSFPVMHEEVDHSWKTNEELCLINNEQVAWLNFTIPVHKQYHRVTEKTDAQNMQLAVPSIFAKRGIDSQYGVSRGRIINSTLLKIIAKTNKGHKSCFSCSDLLSDSYSVIRSYSNNISVQVNMPTTIHSNSEWVISSTIFVQLLLTLILSVLLIKM